MNLFRMLFLGMYYLASLFIVCLATAVNVITLKIHRFGSSNQGRTVPYWLEKIVLGYLASMLCMTIYESDSITLLKTSQVHFKKGICKC